MDVSVSGDLLFFVLATVSSSYSQGGQSSVDESIIVLIFASEKHCKSC